MHWLSVEQTFCCRCRQDRKGRATACRALFGKKGLSFRQKLRRLQHGDIIFSHCALSLGNQPPLQSATCFVGNATDAGANALLFCTVYQMLQ